MWEAQLNEVGERTEQLGVGLRQMMMRLESQHLQQVSDRLLLVTCCGDVNPPAAGASVRYPVN